MVSGVRRPQCWRREWWPWVEPAPRCWRNRATRATRASPLIRAASSIAPLGVERQATAGASDTMTVLNRSKEALTIEVKARPWTQSASGAVSPNRRSTLGGVRVTGGAFTLAPGESRQVAVALGASPSGGSLYGALEVVGLPKDIATRKGIVTGYRLVGALRYHAATKTLRAEARARPRSRRTRRSCCRSAARATRTTP